MKITLTCTPSHCSRTWLLSHWTVSVRCLLLIFPRLTLSLYTTSHTYHQRFLNIRWQIKLITHGHEPSITDDSKPNKKLPKMIGYIVLNYGSLAQVNTYTFKDFACLHLHYKYSVLKMEQANFSETLLAHLQDFTSWSTTIWIWKPNIWNTFCCLGVCTVMMKSLQKVDADFKIWWYLKNY
jgi:hypothetical protein